MAHDRDVFFIHYSLNYIFLEKKKGQGGGWGEGQVRGKLGKNLLPCRLLSLSDPYLTLVLPSAITSQSMAKTSKMFLGAGLCVCVSKGEKETISDTGYLLEV